MIILIKMRMIPSGDYLFQFYGVLCFFLFFFWIVIEDYYYFPFFFFFNGKLYKFPFCFILFFIWYLCSNKSYGSHKNRAFKDESHKGSMDSLDGEEKKDASKEDLEQEEGK